jgi:predicted enzyme related to lactoylglutathione lyase
MDNNIVGWFEVYVADMARARAFYETVFDVQLARLAPQGEAGEKSDIEMWAFPMQHDRYGAPGALVRMEGFQPGGNGVLVYFTCGDCAVQAQRVRAAGGKVVKEKFSIGQFGNIALATDTEGNMIGLHSMA